MNYTIVSLAVLIIASGAALIFVSSLLSKLKKKEEDASEIGVK